jgi:hypothetical protein
VEEEFVVGVVGSGAVAFRAFEDPGAAGGQQGRFEMVEIAGSQSAVVLSGLVAPHALWAGDVDQVLGERLNRRVRVDHLLDDAAFIVVYMGEHLLEPGDGLF